ncbi:MAG: hypothetical protein N2Z65_00215 [Clostridiales bacterium]|nr:hypothetical protein [Clostridiales bacterium]
MKGWLKMKRWKKAAALIAIATLIFGVLSGCESMLERDFYSVSQHKMSTSAPAYQDDGITGYYDLKSAVLNLVRTGVPEKLIRISSYNGNLDEDFKKISQDLLEQDALTAYTVSSIVYEQTRILTYQEVRITIHYSKTALDTDKIIDVINAADFERKVLEELQNYPSKLVFKINYINYSNEIISDLFLKSYYNNPDAAYGLSGYTVRMYPESGTERIAEIDIQYLGQKDDIMKKSKQTNSLAIDITKKVKNNDHLVNAFNIYHYLTQNVIFDSQAMHVETEMKGMQPKSDPYTAYGALIKKTAAPEGYAIAFKKICDLSGIECIVINGTLNDKTPMVWNLVKLNGYWYHVDTAMAAKTKDSSAYFLKNDEAMRKTHGWNQDEYPKADGKEFSYNEAIKRSYQ